MVYVIIIAVIAFIAYKAFKGNADIKNVNKYGGLRNKYAILINEIMARNSQYRLVEKNSNNIQLTNTGMVFRLIEIDKKLQVTWNWRAFGTNKVYKLQWYFEEFQNQDEMYAIINKDVTVQNFMDDGMTKQQAEDWLKISRSNNEVEQERLVNSFSKKYPALWSKITG